MLQCSYFVLNMLIYRYIKTQIWRIRVNITISKSNESKAFMQARLDEVRMSGHMRLQAEAQMARAEAIAEFLGELADGINRVLRKLVLRPFRKLTASLG